MKIFAGNGCPILAYRTSRKLDLQLSSIDLNQFSDGEIGVEILEHVRGEDVFVIQSTCSPANDNLMELAIMADAFKRSDAKRVIAIIPYYGYSRQDRRPKFKRTSISSRLVADLLQAAGVGYVATVEIHSEAQQGFFNVPFVNIDTTSLFVTDIQENYGSEGYTIVSPDVGGVKRARNVAVECGPDVELVIIDKDRPMPNHSKIMEVIGNVEGRNCILVDDMVDTAGTLCNGANELKRRGAKRVVAYCSHPVLSGNAVENISSSGLDEIVVTDTIPLNTDAGRCNKIRVLTVSDLLKETITRIYHNHSISELYKR